ncbi:hypothetical protein INR49_012913, partial [Caranx melampygus]
MVQQSRDLGYRCVVFNNRGVSGETLLTPRTYCAANTEDLETVIEHIQKTNEAAPIMAAGVSMGGMMLANYLGRKGRETCLKGVVVFSAGWDVFECTASLEKPLDRFLFNSYLTSCLQASVHRHRPVLEKCYDIDHVMKAKTIREFDERFTSIMFGYPTNDDYYRDASPVHRLKSVQVPMLCLNAADDVFSPSHAIPVEAVKQNPNLALLITCHGGHIGFLEGLWPRQRIVISGWFGIRSTPHFVIVPLQQSSSDSGSYVAPGQKVEGPVLGAVGRLKLVAQPELPLVLQLQSDDGLTQGAPVLADHTEGGTCGHAFGNSLWLQLCRNLSSRNWAGASRRVCSLSGAQTYWDGLIGAGFSISWREKTVVERKMVVLNILRQVHIEHDKVVEVTPAEGVAWSLVGEAAAPLASAAHCVQGDLRRGLHVLQHHLQRHV